MRVALALSLIAVFLSGCASHADRNPDGTWINQAAIDAAVKGDNLRQALLANGPNLEWQIDTKAGQALYSNGFEVGEGKIASADKGKLRIDYYNNVEDLQVKGDELIQAVGDAVLAAAKAHLAPALEQLPLRLTLHIDATPPGFEGKFSS